MGTNSFVAHGLAAPPIILRRRYLTVTVDFEAFTSSSMGAWGAAMQQWARVSERLSLPSTFFVSVEDAARLRAQDSRAYQHLLTGVGQLHRAGASVHPHNHRIFDEHTGRQLTGANVPKHVPGYAKQASLFYDVRHRHHAPVDEWILAMLSSYRTLCQDAALPLPERLAFRPGGWDCGSTQLEQREYLDAVAAAGVVLHSGDSHGTYGTRGYRIDSRFGENVYRLEPGLLELAPCWALDCSGAGRLSPQFVGALWRLLHQPVSPRASSPGAFVVVLHFDHLFHRGWRSSFKEFSVDSAEEIRTRIERTLVLMARLARILQLTPTRLDDIVLPPGSGILARGHVR